MDGTNPTLPSGYTEQRKSAQVSQNNVLVGLIAQRNQQAVSVNKQQFPDSAGDHAKYPLRVFSDSDLPTLTLSTYVNMGSVAQLNRYVAFVNQYRTPAEVQRYLGRVVQEYRALSDPMRRTINRMIDTVDMLNASITQHNDSIMDTRRETCRQWNSLSPQQRQADYDSIEAHWNALEQDYRDQIAELTAYIDTQIRYFDPSIPQHIQACQDLLQTRIQQRASLPELSQARGEKVRSQKITPRPGSRLHRLCQQQVLPPESSFVSTAASQSSRDRPDLLIDMTRFVPESATGTWQFSDLGEGGQGKTSLWNFVATNGNVLQRIVVKDTMPSGSDQQFKDPRHWHGDTSDFDIDSTCVPLEFHTQQLVSMAPGFPNGVKLFGSPQIMWEDLKYRLYMECAPCGDTQELIREHSRRDEPIPEAFLWMCFQALLRNALVMEQGGLETARNPWSQIVHCDMKAANLFLGLPDPGFYPQYPTPKLGDFGIAFVTDDRDETNPIMWSEGGTEGHFAPEQIYWADSILQEPMNDHMMLSPCNVYGAATIMYQLMERQRDVGPQPPYTPEEDGSMFQLSEMTYALYGDDPDGLCVLVDQCLQSDPDSRPLVGDLLFTIDSELYSQDRQQERGGAVDPFGDTLLTPGEDVKLRWQSRILDGTSAVDGTRIERDSDEEMFG